MEEQEEEEEEEKEEAGCIVALLMCRGVGIREGRGQLEHTFFCLSAHMSPRLSFFR